MRKFRLGILNYGMGNIASVRNSLNYLSIKNDLINNSNDLHKYTHIILPGVGSFKTAIINLKKKKYFNILKKLASTKKIKILGICLGMQLLGKSSIENGKSEGLGLIDINVKKFKKTSNSFRVPHVGFNTICIKNEKSKFFKDIKNGSDFYFVHSFRMEYKRNFTFDLATSNYGEEFLAAFNIDNIFGTQFHPEKSQGNGLRLLYNFSKS